MFVLRRDLKPHERYIGAPSADPEHLHILSQGIDFWNAWREQYPHITPNLAYADLKGAKLSGFAVGDWNGRANFSRANLEGTDFTGAQLWDANFFRAHLERTLFVGAKLNQAEFIQSNLFGVNMSGANLKRTCFTLANLRSINFSNSVLTEASFLMTYIRRTRFTGALCDSASLNGTVFSDTDFSAFCTASNIQVQDPCSIDWSSISRSLECLNLKDFLGLCKMPKAVTVNILDTLNRFDPGGLFAMNQSTFISYGGDDEAFAAKLAEALKENGVRIWFFPESAVPGEKIHNEVRKGIHEYERVILICSESSLQRSGVLNEIEQVITREAREGGASILLPIRLDDYIFDWEPEESRSYLKQEILDRVVADFKKRRSSKDFDAALDKLLIALSR